MKKIVQKVLVGPVLLVHTLHCPEEVEPSISDAFTQSVVIEKALPEKPEDSNNTVGEWTTGEQASITNTPAKQSGQASLQNSSDIQLRTPQQNLPTATVKQDGPSKQQQVAIEQAVSQRSQSLATSDDASDERKLTPVENAQNLINNLYLDPAVKNDIVTNGVLLNHMINESLQTPQQVLNYLETSGVLKAAAIKEGNRIIQQALSAAENNASLTAALEKIQKQWQLTRETTPTDLLDEQLALLKKSIAKQTSWRASLGHGWRNLTSSKTQPISDKQAQNELADLMKNAQDLSDSIQKSHNLVLKQYATKFNGIYPKDLQEERASLKQLNAEMSAKLTELINKTKNTPPISFEDFQQETEKLLVDYRQKMNFITGRTLVKMLQQTYGSDVRSSSFSNIMDKIENNQNKTLSNSDLQQLIYEIKTENLLPSTVSYYTTSLVQSAFMAGVLAFFGGAPAALMLPAITYSTISLAFPRTMHSYINYYIDRVLQAVSRQDSQ